MPKAIDKLPKRTCSINNTGTRIKKKWFVSGITLSYLYIFWLAEHESEFKKAPSPSSFEQTAEKTLKSRKSSIKLEKSEKL